nr:hypothetical protein 3 - Trypanosoma brucei mitochondrion [Trypanosoma brucei]
SKRGILGGREGDRRGNEGERFWEGGFLRGGKRILNLNYLFKLWERSKEEKSRGILRRFLGRGGRATAVLKTPIFRRIRGEKRGNGIGNCLCQTFRRKSRKG